MTSIFGFTQIVTWIYMATMFIAAVAFLINWIMEFSYVKRYIKYGVILALVMLVFEVSMLLLNPGAFDGGVIFVVAVLVLEPIVLTRMMGFASLGCLYAAELGHPSLPLLLRWFTKPAERDKYTTVGELDVMVEEPVFDESALKASDEMSTEPVNLCSERVPFTDVLLAVPWYEYVLISLAVTTFGILWSKLLFMLTQPTLSEMMQSNFGVTPGIADQGVTLVGIIAGLEFAVGEEIMFRLGLQTFLAKHFKLNGKKYWLAILIPTFIWTMAHVGVLAPGWVKLVQVFPIGILLGILYRKRGAECSILSHAVFNTAAMLLSSWLVA